MDLRSMVNTLPLSEASIRIHKSTITLSASAVALLGLDENSHVSFKVDSDELSKGRFRCYVARVPKGVDSFALHRDDKRLVVNNTTLCRKMISGFGSEGIYRICPEDSYIINGCEWFNIFHKNYK